MLSVLRRVTLMEPPPVCFQFLRGRCAYGASCKFLHQHPAPLGYLHQQHAQYVPSSAAHKTSAYGRGSRSSGFKYSKYSSRKSSGNRPLEPNFYERSWQESLQALTHQEDEEVQLFSFRVMSYNLLASHLSWAHAEYLYPDRAHDDYLDWFKHRQPLALQEILHWSPDVICTQEVDHYPELAHQLASKGYAGAFMQRTGGHRDGCATFWRTSRLVAVRMEHVAFNRYDLKDNVALLVHLAPKTTSNSGSTPTSAPAQPEQGPVKTAPAGAAATTEALEGAAGGVIIANTHILFNTKRGDVKLGQLRTVLHRMKDMASTAACEGASVGCMLAGDFNSAPGSPLYQFMQNGILHLNQFDKQTLSGQVEGIGHAHYQQALLSGCPSKQGYKPDIPSIHPLTRHYQQLQAQQQQQQQQQQAQAQVFEGPYAPNAYKPWTDPDQPQKPAPLGNSVEHQEQQPQRQKTEQEVQQVQMQQQQQRQVQQQQMQQQQAQQRPDLGRYVHWDDEGLRLALGVCPTTLPSTIEAFGRLSTGGNKAQRTDFQAQREAARRQQARQGLLTVRAPLYPLQSAYATVSGQEPVFSTCHSRCIDTVDYIWYTPYAFSSRDQQAARSSALSPPLNSSTLGGATTSNVEYDMDCEDASGDGAGQASLSNSHEQQAQHGSGPLVLHPVRVLLPPDSTRFPLGMPNCRWPSDHVCLVSDFHLLLRAPKQ